MILEAIRERVWLPEQIEKVTSRYALEGGPLPLEGVEPWIDRAIDRRAKALVAKAKPSTTALAAAYRKARDRVA